MTRLQRARLTAATLCLFVLVAPALQAQTAPQAAASSASSSSDDDLPDLSTLDDSGASSSSSSDSLGGDIDINAHPDDATIAAEALTCVGVYDLAIDNNMQEPGTDAAQRVTDLTDKRDSVASLYMGSAAKLQADADADEKVADADVAAKVARGDMVLDTELSTCDDLVDTYGGWA